MLRYPFSRRKSFKRVRQEDAQPFLGQLPLALRHGTDSHEVQRKHFLEHGEARGVDVPVRKICWLLGIR